MNRKDGACAGPDFGAPGGHKGRPFSHMNGKRHA
jgi:hypothetical protein